MKLYLLNSNRALLIYSLLLFLVFPGVALSNINVVCIGDSIVSTYTDTSYRQGWGESIKQKLVNTTVYNQAVSGRSSKSFINEGLWAAALNIIDSTSAKYVFIEFGHNDNPDKGEDRKTDPSVDGDYRIYLRQYINESREHGAVPILVTSPPRRKFNDGIIGDTGNLAYAQAMIAVAAEESCSVIDLNSKVRILFNSLGEINSDYLVGSLPDWSKDNTHFSHAGAMILAGMIVDDLITKEVDLAQYINSNGGPGAIGAANSPVPLDVAVNIDTSPVLAWTQGANALGHAIYFGSTNPPPFIGNITASTPVTYTPGTLERSTTYYWRINAVNQHGISTGNIWSFSTRSPATSLEIDEEYILPEDDSRLYSGDGDTNYGGWGSFWARNLGDIGTMNTGIIQFRLPDDGRILYQARLELFNKRDQNTKTVRIFALNDRTAGEDIDESTITYNNAPGINSQTATLNSDTTELFSITGGLAETACISTANNAQQAMDNFISKDTNGILTFLVAGSSGAMEFYTKDGATSDLQRPRLHLWYLNNGCPDVYLGDMNYDCNVDLIDFEILAGQWLDVPAIPSADIIPIVIGNGNVGFEDLEGFITDWLAN